MNSFRHRAEFFLVDIGEVEANGIEFGAHAARVEFAMEYEFSSRVLAKVLEPLFGQIADTMVDAFVRRAEALYGRAAG